MIWIPGNTPPPEPFTSEPKRFGLLNVAKSVPDTKTTVQQEDRILSKITELGLEPLNLPYRKNGHSGSKAIIKSTLVIKAGTKNTMTESQFEKAWERLLKKNKISEALS